jgi:hypothetical protein
LAGFERRAFEPSLSKQLLRAETPKLAAVVALD